MTWSVRSTCNIVFELYNLFECPQADGAIHIPGGERLALLEDRFNLFKCASSSLRKHEEYVDKCCEVEGAEHEVGLVRDSGEAGGNGPRKPEVEQPV